MHQSTSGFSGGPSWGCLLIARNSYGNRCLLLVILILRLSLLGFFSFFSPFFIISIFWAKYWSTVLSLRDWRVGTDTGRRRVWPEARDEIQQPRAKQKAPTAPRLPMFFQATSKGYQGYLAKKLAKIASLGKFGFMFWEIWICQNKEKCCQAILCMFPKPFVGKFWKFGLAVSYGLESPQFPKTCHFGKFSVFLKTGVALQCQIGIVIPSSSLPYGGGHLRYLACCIA